MEAGPDAGEEPRGGVTGGGHEGVRRAEGDGGKWERRELFNQMETCQPTTPLYTHLSFSFLFHFF